MKITFYSNFLNHHQLPFCNEMINILGENFRFVATEKIPEERLKLKYDDLNDKYSFVVKAYEDEQKALELAKKSDVVILGSASTKYLRISQKEKKICFRYSEHVYKTSNLISNIKLYLLILLRKSLLERNVYMLCSSAFAENDYYIAGAYINKCYKWGYFPETIVYKDINDIIDKKKKHSILWVGRFLKWKHPETVIEISNKLKKEGYNCSVEMIGTGPLKNRIKELIEENDLNDIITLYDSMPAKEIRKKMEKSEIFLFTSDRGEGWGAVLNESMNSGCAVIASHSIGSVPFLIKNMKNGLIYEDGNIDDLFEKVMILFNGEKSTKKLGIEAYKTITKLWNSKVAANRLVNLCKRIMKEDEWSEYTEGPCSKTERISYGWFLKQGKGDK